MCGGIAAGRSAKAAAVPRCRPRREQRRPEVSLLAFGTGEHCARISRTSPGEARVGRASCATGSGGPAPHRDPLGPDALLSAATFRFLGDGHRPGDSRLGVGRLPARPRPLPLRRGRRSARRAELERDARCMLRNAGSDDGIGELRARALAADGAGRALDQKRIKRQLLVYRDRCRRVAASSRPGR